MGIATVSQELRQLQQINISSSSFHLSCLRYALALHNLNLFDQPSRKTQKGQYRVARNIGASLSFQINQSNYYNYNSLAQRQTAYCQLIQREGSKRPFKSETNSFPSTNQPPPTLSNHLHLTCTLQMVGLGPGGELSQHQLYIHHSHLQAWAPMTLHLPFFVDCAHRGGHFVLSSL